MSSNILKSHSPAFFQVKILEGKKREGKEYGSGKGQTLVGQYKRGRFGVWHCKDAFEEGSECVDGVCLEYKVDDKNKVHRCEKCKQKLADYKCEETEGTMTRRRRNLAGPGPVMCAICEIVL